MKTQILTVFAIVLMALCVGCAQKPGDSYTVYVDPSMSHDELNATFEALADWETRAPVVFDIRVEDRTVTASDGYAFSIHAVDVPNKSCEGGEWASAYACTTVTNVYNVGVSGNSYLPTAFDPMWPRAVAHEIGHELGLEHTGPGTLMCAWNQCMAPGITCADLEQFYSVRGETAPACTDQP